MGTAEAAILVKRRRERFLIVRKRLITLADLARGTSSKVVESVVCMLVRKIVVSLSPEEQLALSESPPVFPTWLDEEVVRKLLADPTMAIGASVCASVTEEETPTEAVVPVDTETLRAPQGRYLRTRACELWASSNRPQLRREAEAKRFEGLDERTLQQIMGSLAWTYWQALSVEARGPFIIDAARGPSRVRHAGTGVFLRRRQQNRDEEMVLSLVPTEPTAALPSTSAPPVTPTKKARRDAEALGTAMLSMVKEHKASNHMEKIMKHVAKRAGIRQPRMKQLLSGATGVAVDTNTADAMCTPQKRPGRKRGFRMVSDDKILEAVRVWYMYPMYGIVLVGYT
jgi:hypothetical protein